LKLFVILNCHFCFALVTHVFFNILYFNVIFINIIWFESSKISWLKNYQMSLLENILIFIIRNDSIDLSPVGQRRTSRQRRQQNESIWSRVSSNLFCCFLWLKWVHFNEDIRLIDSYHHLDFISTMIKFFLLLLWL
jgi:hypothetical protein